MSDVRIGVSVNANPSPRRNLQAVVLGSSMGMVTFLMVLATTSAHWGRAAILLVAVAATALANVFAAWRAADLARLRIVFGTWGIMTAAVVAVSGLVYVWAFVIYS